MQSTVILLCTTPIFCARFQNASPQRQQSAGRLDTPPEHIQYPNSGLKSHCSSIFKCWVLSREKSITKIKAFGLTQPGIEPTTFHTQGEHAINHYTTEALIYTSYKLYPTPYYGEGVHFVYWFISVHPSVCLL